nr:MAG TPA: hypothetical protein [Caudoviricetes sp.]
MRTAFFSLIETPFCPPSAGPACFCVLRFSRPAGPEPARQTRGSVRRRIGRVAGHALDADHILLHQTLGGAHPLPAHGSALVQRVVAIAKLLDDVLQTAAFQLGDTIGVGTQHQRAEHGQTGRAGGVLPDLGLAGLDETDVAQLADLAAEHGLRVGILMHLDELPAGLQVVGGIGVDDGDVAVADGVGVHRAQLGCRLEEQLRGQGAGLVQTGAAGHGRLGAVGTLLGRIENVGAARQHIAGDAVHGAARLAGQHTGGLHDVVVDGGHLQHIGQRGPAAILVQVAGDGGHVQGLAVGGHTLGQRGGGLGQAVVLAELDGLAAVLGHRVVIRKLVVDEARLSLVDEALLIEGLHLGGHGAGGIVQRGGRVGEQLEVELHCSVVHTVFLSFLQCNIRTSSIRAPLPEELRSERDDFPMEGLAFQRFPLGAGHAGNICPGHGGAAGAGAVLCRAGRPLPDALHDALLHGMGGLAQCVLVVGQTVGVRHPHPRQLHQTAHLWVLQLRFQRELRHHLPQRCFFGCPAAVQGGHGLSARQMLRQRRAGRFRGGTGCFRAGVCLREFLLRGLRRRCLLPARLQGAGGDGLPGLCLAQGRGVPCAAGLAAALCEQLQVHHGRFAPAAQVCKAEVVRVALGQQGKPGLG